MLSKNKKHSKCKGFWTPDYGYGSDFDCGYKTIIDCENCKYGVGKKNPEAKCNSIKLISQKKTIKNKISFPKIDEIEFAPIKEFNKSKEKNPWTKYWKNMT